MRVKRAWGRRLEQHADQVANQQHYGVCHSPAFEAEAFETHDGLTGQSARWSGRDGVNTDSVDLDRQNDGAPFSVDAP